MPASVIIRAHWLLPIDRPVIDGGWVEVAGGRILRLERGPAPSGARDLGDVALLPGLVNAHTHLELSRLSGQVPPAASLVEWVRALLAARRRAAPVDAAESVRAMEAAAASMRETGTVLVGDVSNSLASVPVLRGSGLASVVFHELTGFRVDDPAAAVRDAWRRAGSAEQEAVGPGELSLSVVAHAPYSVSPQFFAEIARRSRETPLSVHLAESAEEVEFLHTGRGPFRTLLEELDAWHDGWEAPRCDPVEYLKQVGYLRPGLLAVHGVHLTEDGLDRLRASRAVVVSCPRSNEWVGGGLPRISRFYGSGVRVAIGTDSLASVSTLNLFDELAELRRIAPDVSAGSLLESATRVGAEALGYGRTYGTLASGKRADMVSVDVPPGVTDVEEYLVGGVPPAAIRRLSA